MSQGDLSILNNLLSSRPADVIVDLSNLLRSSISRDEPRWQNHHNGCAHLEALMTFVSAWLQTWNHQPSISAIADESLSFSFCDPGEQAIYRSWVEHGYVREVPYADATILEDAELSGLPVFSNDHFRGFRRTHRWMDRHPERFLHWALRSARPTIEQGLPGSWEGDVSIAEETDMVRAGIVPFEYKDAAWNCLSEACEFGVSFHSRFPAVPTYRSGFALCPACRNRLVSANAKTHSVLVKALDDSGPVLMVRVFEGATLSLGRGGIPGIIPVLGGGSGSTLMSRHHMDLRLFGGQLQVRDVGSLNGIRRFRWDQGRKSVLAAGRLSNEWSQLFEREYVEFPGTGLRLRLSSTSSHSQSLLPEGPNEAQQFAPTNHF